jgi:hypothetical protein
VAAEVIATSTRASPRRRSTTEALQAYLMLFPAILIIAVF